LAQLLPDVQKQPLAAAGVGEMFLNGLVAAGQKLTAAQSLVALPLAG
jgi:hypothetical protein